MDFLVALGPNAFAIEYSNYTSGKYKIQFEYPNDWTVTEKTSRFESGADIRIEPSSLLKGSFNIIYGDDDLVTDFGASNLEAAVYKFLESETRGSYEFRIIEKPSFITIDNQNGYIFSYT